MSLVVDAKLITPPYEEWSDQECDDTDVLTGATHQMQGKRMLGVFAKGDANTGSIHIIITAEVSWDGTNWAAGSGTAGQVIADMDSATYVFGKLELPPAKYFRIKATGLATNGSDIDLYLSWVIGAL